MYPIIPKLGGRRFIMAMGCGMVCTVLVFFGKISGEVFATIILGTIGGYITGNLVQRIKAPTGGAEPE